MVITVQIENFSVMKTLIDQGSSVDVLYWSIFKKLCIPESEIQPYDDQVVGFSGERVDTRGYIDLYTKFGGEEGESSLKTIKIRYLLIDANTSNNVLFGRPSLNLLGAIVSTPHLAMKFRSPMGDIITVHVDQKTAQECYATSLRVESRSQEVSSSEERIPKRGQVVVVTELDSRIEEVRVEPKEDVRYVPLVGNDNVTQIGISLSKEDVAQLNNTLQENASAFAWTAADIPGVDPTIITHKLSTFKDVRPVALKKRKLGEEKRIAV